MARFRLPLEVVLGPPGPESHSWERLEWVRKAKRCTTLREFWEKLREGGTYRISYESVRGYHSTREAPAHYYARVAEVFDVRLEWLITGEGPDTYEYEREPSAELLYWPFQGPEPYYAFVHEVPFFEKVRRSVREVFVGTWRRYAQMAGVDPSEEDLPLELGATLAKLLMAPFETFQSKPDFRSQEFHDYALAMIHALDLATTVRRESLQEG